MTPSPQLGQPLERLQLVNALVWGLTVLGVAVVGKASEDFIYVLLVLSTGSLASWAAIWSLAASTRTGSRSPDRLEDPHGRTP